MTGEIDAHGFFFHGKQLTLRILFQIRDHRIFNRLLFFFSEQRHLPFDGIFSFKDGGGNQRVIQVEHLHPVQAERIAGPGFDEPFRSFAVEVMQRHPAAEIGKAGENTVRLPFFDDIANQFFTDVFDGTHAEADVFAVDGKVRIRAVDVRRQNGNAERFAFADVFGYFGRVAQNAGQKRAHILLRVAAFQIGRLIGNQCICRGVSLIKGVSAEIQHGLKNRGRRFFIDAVGNAAGNTFFFVAVEEIFTFLPECLGFLFADRAADNIRPPH